MDYLQREQEAFELDKQEEIKQKEKTRKARDEKDYSTMLMELVRDEVKKL